MVEYLVTGAAGHLGMNVINELLKRKLKVKVLVREKENYLPSGIEIIEGNILNKDDLETFFKEDGYEHIVIHLAGIVSISSYYNKNVYNTNVNGTKNIVDMCLSKKVKRLIYTSSVHAIKEEPMGRVIKETKIFNPNLVHGLYAKTKAIATKYVLDAKDKLDVIVVHPSGIIGPYDYAHSHLIALVKDYCNGNLKAAIKGGYDFVDARDVAYGIVEASIKASSGECYLLTNKYYQIKDILDICSKIANKKPIKVYLPLWFARVTAPLSEAYYHLLKKPPLYTSYSLYTLKTNSHFSHEKATKELNYNPRSMEGTLKATIKFLKEIGKIKE
jgi:dihydroflavonol-4-reductase